MTAPDVDLAPIRVTRTMPRRTRSGNTRPEVWAAETLDGRFRLGREESPGTPWLVVEIASGTCCGFVSNIEAAQHHVASGEADRELARLAAHDAGEHDRGRDGRDEWCPRC
jgi:hypothetical protein